MNCDEQIPKAFTEDQNNKKTKACYSERSHLETLTTSEE